MEVKGVVGLVGAWRGSGESRVVVESVGGIKG